MEIGHNGPGFKLVTDIIPSDTIDSINNRKDELYPVRASSHKKHAG